MTSDRMLTIARGMVAALASAGMLACTDTPTTPTTPTSQATASAPSAQLKRTKFMAFGDSITAGEITLPVTNSLTGFPSFKTIQVLSAAYPTVLNSMLKARYPSQASVIFVANAGLGADKAEYAMERFDAAFDLYRPDAVLLMEGYNDICCGNNEVGVRKAEIGLSDAAADARNRGARVFIATLAPSKPGSRSTPLNIVQSANERIQVVARGEGAYLVDVYSALLPEVATNIGIDGLHPTEIGYQRIAEAFLAAIRADLEVR
ncbi:MAG: SGNH/GDSL hydrolase family protein [Vicinamibacterales bacterium]